MSKKQFFNVKQLVFSGALLALAFVLSYIRIFHFPTGGSVTLCSMLFVTLIGYFFGFLPGLLGAFVYSLLQFIQGPSFLSFLQFLFDYVLAFSALGLSGLFHRSRYGLVTGFLFAAFFRFVFATLASLFFWAEYLPEGFVSPLLASLVYNGSYIGTEAVITVVILIIPPVNHAIRYLKDKFLN